MSNQTPDFVPAVTSILERGGVADARADALAIVESVTRLGDADQMDRAVKMAADRARGMPLAYVLGRTRFMDIDLMAVPGALVPRTETELLGRAALSLVEDLAAEEPHIIDMCCGSGNLACAIAAHAPSSRVWASDLTDEAVRVARANVNHLELADRVAVVQSDLFAGLAGLALEQRIDLIVCNPPYISTRKLGQERAELLLHEPREAFDGGPYGVTIFQRVVRDAVAYLKPGGVLMFEVGIGQHLQVSGLFARSAQYEPTRMIDDEYGRPRVVAARKHAV